MEIILRRMSKSDINRVLEIRNDPETYNFLHTPKVFNFEQANDWFDKNKPVWFVIQSPDEVVGYVRTSEWNFENKSVWIGCDVHKDYRRKGIAFSAYNQVIDKLRQYGMNIVFLSVLKINERAISLYKKLNFSVISETQDSLNMELKIGNNICAGKGVKVISCYFGNRRSSGTAGRGPYNAKEAYPMLEYIWHCDQNLEQGYQYDTCFVHNKLLPTDLCTEPEYAEKCTQLLNSFNGKKTKNGIARVITRDNIGISFGAFAHAFDVLESEYDYWFFTEDDQIIVKENVFIEGIKQLSIPTDEQISGFVATVGVQREWGMAAMGGCGISRREILKNITSKHHSEYYGKNTLPFKYVRHLSDQCIQTTNAHEVEGEVAFTRLIYNDNYYLADHNFEDINVSWQDYDKRTRNCMPFQKYMENINNNPIPDIKVNNKFIGLWRQSNNDDIFEIKERECVFNSKLNGYLISNVDIHEISWNNKEKYCIKIISDDVLEITTLSGFVFNANRIK